MVFEPKHDRPYFFKYTSFDAALFVLSNYTLRWSSPLLFNDPFDFQIRLGLNFEDDEEYYVKKFCELSLSQLTEKDISSYLTKMQAMGNWFDKDEDEQNKEYRILCLAERNDNILMWSHYSDNHRGVVLKLKCIPELDTPTLAAKKVKYQESVPVIYTREEWMESLLTGKGRLSRISDEEIFALKTLTKSIIWKYEEEWRIFSKKSQDNGQLYEDVPFYPEEIEAIYLGCCMIEENKKKIFDLARNLNAKVYQAKKDKNKYALNFEEIVGF